MRDKEEQKKILAVVDKYSDYFNEWNADIALGMKGPNFFYVLDEEHEYFDVFCPFETAEELETLILGDIASDVSTYVYAEKESYLKAFDQDTVNDAYKSFSPETSIQSLVHDMKLMAEINAKWSDLMGRTYRSIANIGKVREEKEV